MIPPSEVTAPKAHWTLIHVLFTNEEWALAVGKWDGRIRLACRWNGDEESPKGNPVSHGVPTWFVLPDDLVEPILSIVPLDKRPLLDALLKKDAA